MKTVFSPLVLNQIDNMSYSDTAFHVDNQQLTTPRYFWRDYAWNDVISLHVQGFIWGCGGICPPPGKLVTSLPHPLDSWHNVQCYQKSSNSSIDSAFCTFFYSQFIFSFVGGSTPFHPSPTPCACIYVASLTCWLPIAVYIIYNYSTHVTVASY